MRGVCERISGGAGTGRVSSRGSAVLSGSDKGFCDSLLYEKQGTERQGQCTVMPLLMRTLKNCSPNPCLHVCSSVCRGNGDMETRKLSRDRASRREGRFELSHISIVLVEYVSFYV